VKSRKKDVLFRPTCWLQASVFDAKLALDLIQGMEERLCPVVEFRTRLLQQCGRWDNKGSASVVSPRLLPNLNLRSLRVLRVKEALEVRVHEDWDRYIDVPNKTGTEARSWDPAQSVLDGG
jgi:hypothetical protein